MLTRIIHDSFGIFSEYLLLVLRVSVTVGCSVAEVRLGGLRKDYPKVYNSNSSASLSLGVLNFPEGN